MTIEISNEMNSDGLSSMVSLMVWDLVSNRSLAIDARDDGSVGGGDWW